MFMCLICASSLQQETRAVIGNDGGRLYFVSIVLSSPRDVLCGPRLQPRSRCVTVAHEPAHFAASYEERGYWREAEHTASACGEERLYTIIAPLSTLLLSKRAYSHSAARAKLYTAGASARVGLLRAHSAA